MAHELSISNGKAEAFYSLQPAWHGLGTVLDYAPSSEVAIEAAHLDWEVDLQPLLTADMRQVPDYFATVRQDTGEVLGVVSSRYQVVQNREAFAFLDSLLDDGSLQYESAGALRGGRIVWLLARMPSVDTVADGDDSLRYILFSTSHDGSAAIHAIPTAVRVVCANTLRVATARDIGIRHTGDVRGKLDAARRYLSQFDRQFTEFRDHAQLLAHKRYSRDEAQRYIDTLFPETAQLGRSHSIRERKVREVRSAFRASRQNLPSIRGSWWSLYNSVSEAIDHGHAMSVRGKDRQAKAENRMLSVMDGMGADLKDKAFRLALEMAS